MSARWLNEPELETWTRFIAVVELLPGVLDAQLRRDSGLTHFEYMVMAMLSEAPNSTLRMSRLAARTNATLARLSHVVTRLERRGLVQRTACTDDRRATDARLTADGRSAIEAAAPGHVATVRRAVIDALTPDQVDELGAISAAVLARIDPAGSMTAAPVSAAGQ